jgi:RNA polymerase sigma-70 factor (ECF subfamily)
VDIESGLTEARRGPREQTPDEKLRRRFEDLALPHLRAVYGLALRLTGDPATAEDLAQETYLKAFKAFGSLRDPGRVRPWLFQILSRLVADLHRGAPDDVTALDPHDLDRFSLYDLVWEEDPFPYSDRLHDEFLAAFRDEDVRRALLGLPEAYRIPLVLLYAAGLSYREMADVLDCPMGTVMSRLHRGRKILERELWECAKRRGLVKEWKA